MRCLSAVNAVNINEWTKRYCDMSSQRSLVIPAQPAVQIRIAAVLR